MRNVNLISKLQGIFWALTGLWPMLHLDSFIWVTGPKKDIWLLYTVAILILVIGLVLLVAGIRQAVTREIKWLGIGSALGLTFIDVYYSTNNVISDIYRYDAIVEVGFVIMWVWAGHRGMAFLREHPSDKKN